MAINAGRSLACICMSLPVSASVISHGTFSLCLSLFLSAYLDTSHIRLRTHSTLMWPHLNLYLNCILQRSCFQIKSDSQVAGIKTSIYLFGRVQSTSQHLLQYFSTFVLFLFEKGSLCSKLASNSLSSPVLKLQMCAIRPDESC